jgi:hypothetical protein
MVKRRLLTLGVTALALGAIGVPSAMACGGSSGGHGSGPGTFATYRGGDHQFGHYSRYDFRSDRSPRRGRDCNQATPPVTPPPVTPPTDPAPQDPGPEL